MGKHYHNYVNYARHIIIIMRFIAEHTFGEMRIMPDVILQAITEGDNCQYLSSEIKA